MYYEIVYDMSVNVNVIYYVHVCEQAHWARSAGNSAIENLCIIIIIIVLGVLKIVCGWANKTWFLLYERTQKLYFYKDKDQFRFTQNLTTSTC